MANEQKDGGAVQDIEIFNVKASAENFRDTTDEFAKDVEDIQKIEKKPLKRRISLNKTDDAKKPSSLKIVFPLRSNLRVYRFAQKSTGQSG